MQALLDTISHMPLPEGAQRIFHGRGGLHPGCEQWVLDAFPPVFVLTSFQEVPEEDVAQVQAAIAARWQQIAPGQALNLAFQCRQLAQKLAHQTAQGDTQLRCGTVPDPHVVSESDARYRVHVMRGQNHGLFLDMAEGRRWVSAHVAQHAQAHPEPWEGLKVLNLFAYTCAFSVVALRAGARQVVNLDMSHGALNIGQQNHQLNGLTQGANFLPHDIFTTWGKVNRMGPYGLIIVDPPSYQKGSFVATKDYARLIRRLPDLLLPGGHALLCLNAPEMGPEFITEQMQELTPELTFVERLANPTAFADVAPERALKVLVYRAPGV